MKRTVGWLYDPVFLEHETGDHEENARRLVVVHHRLVESGLIHELVSLPVRQATREEVLAVHSSRLVDQLERFAATGGGWLTPDTVMSRGSFQAALWAAGAACAAVDGVMQGLVRSAFALVRPPGHHATPTRAMGFCLLNNVAIAARRLIDRHDLDRLLIIDFDVHHGNGTQEIFYADPRVLYFSIHEYPFYPGTGRLEETGTGPGVGTTVNLPFPAYSGDRQYQLAIDEVLIPVARRFAPQFVLVSAGYDAHWADPLAFMQVTLHGFTALVRAAQRLADEWCDGRLVLCLEGGYHLDALPRCIQATFEVLLGRDVDVADLPRPAHEEKATPDVRPILAAARRIHQLEHAP